MKAKPDRFPADRRSCPEFLARDRSEFAGFLPWVATIAGAVLAGLFVKKLDSNWGTTNGKFIDMGMIALSGALGWLVGDFVCGEVFAMIVLNMLSS